MPANESVYIVDITSGLVSKVLAYLDAVARELGNPPELASIFPGDFSFDFSRIRVSVQLSEQRLRYEETRQRERERAAGIWTEEEKSASRYARRSAEEYEEQSKQAAVREWEQVRGNIHHPRFQRAIILGDPGFGKSWLLRYEGRELAQEEIKRLQQSEVGTAGVLIPVFARLARLAEKLENLAEKDEEVSLLTGLRAVLKERGVSSELQELIEEKAKNGQALLLLLLLLDGWDEVRVGQEKLKEALAVL